MGGLRRRGGIMTHEELAEEMQTSMSDEQLYFIIRHPWRYSKDIVDEAGLILEGVMGIGAVSFIAGLSEEELYAGGTK